MSENTMGNTMSTELIVKIFKKSLEKTIREIAKFQECDEEEEEELVKKYLKPNYYIPIITKQYKKEQEQRVNIKQ
jgi:hypothetical protein